MPLSLIVGPPNSGRTGLIRERVVAGLARDPVLVVPTLDDVARFERELVGGGVVLGASILTFGRLFEEVARAAGAELRPGLTKAQELHLVRRAIDAAELRILARSARRPGFAPALAGLIEELQGGALDPDTVADRAAEAESGGAYLGEIAAVYRAYAELRDELGRGDTHLAAAAATAALRSRPDSWGGRAVLLYGFDDMTVEQLELVSALGAATEVTATVTYEDRAALAARATLREELRERGGVVVAEPTPDPANTESAVLFHLERSFLVDGADRSPLDDGVALMEAAGERGQAEQIAAAVARLLHEGTSPDEIAVVLRAPDRDGPLYEDVLAGMGVPVAVDARVPAARTAVGRGLIALLRAESPVGTAADVLAFLRTPGRALPSSADWLERSVRRERIDGAEAALEAWNGREVFELDALREAAGPAELLKQVARLARMLAEYPVERLAPRPEREQRLELRAAAAAADALEQIAELGGIEDGRAEAIACLEALEVPLWAGPSDGHVRVTSPYSIRARRVPHLFVGSLQEGEFPGATAAIRCSGTSSAPRRGCARAPTSSTRSATCSTCACRGRCAGCTCAGGAATTTAPRRSARRSSTTSVSCWNRHPRPGRTRSASGSPAAACRRSRCRRRRRRAPRSSPGRSRRGGRAGAPRSPPSWSSTPSPRPSFGPGSIPRRSGSGPSPVRWRSRR